MKYCTYEIIITKDENGEDIECIVPVLRNVRVKINPNPKDDSEFYIIY